MYLSRKNMLRKKLLTQPPFGHLVDLLLGLVFHILNQCFCRITSTFSSVINLTASWRDLTSSLISATWVSFHQKSNILYEKNPSDGIETPSEEEVRGRITERKKDASKRDKARSKSRPPKPPLEEGASGESIEDRVTAVETVVEMRELLFSEYFQMYLWKKHT